MKRQKIITGDIRAPYAIAQLNYHGVVVKGGFTCSHTKITSLKGAPVFVGGNFDCSNTTLESLHNIHKHVKYIGGILGLPMTVKSHIIGVMFIKGLQKIKFYVMAGTDQYRVEKIINKHLGGNPHECQEELIEAGLVEYARL